MRLGDLMGSKHGGHPLEAELYERVRTDPSVFEFLQAGCLDGLWYWDLENMDEEWMSPGFWRLFGYDPEDMPHKASAWQDMIFAEDLELATANAQQHLADPSHPYDQIVRYRHKDGSTVWVRCRGMALRDEQGKPIRMLGAHTDVTELKSLEADLRSSNEELQRFAHTASHDLKGPLHSISVYLDLLSEDYGDALGEGGQRMLQASVRAAGRMEKMVNGLLQYSRVETIQATHESVALDDLLADLLADFDADLAGEQIEITAGELPVVSGNHFLLSQVLRNLISNAIKYRKTDAPNRIDIRSEEGDEDWIIHVQDTGMGVPEKFQADIFEMFRRLHSWAEVEGSGLGLNLVQKAMLRMGGKVWVESEEGVGSTFSFSLPK